MYGPLPGSLSVQLEGTPDAVIGAAAREVAAAGLKVVQIATDEGYLETEWYDVAARRTVNARVAGFDHIVKLRLFADPTAGRTRLAAECVVRIGYDPSMPTAWIRASSSNLSGRAATSASSPFSPTTTNSG